MSTIVDAETKPSGAAPPDLPWSRLPPGAMMELDLTEIEESAISHLKTASSSWLSSFGFATLYAQPPATHAWIRLGEQAQIKKVCFFFEQQWKWRLKRVHVFGPTDMTPDEIMGLLRKRHASFATISCTAVDDMARWNGPWHHRSWRPVNEDIIVDLPGSESEYLCSLGRNAQTQLPYYLKKLQKELGSKYAVISLTGPQIPSATFQELVELNRARIVRKGVSHLWEAQHVRNRLELARTCGLFCGIRRGDELLAGTVSYLHGNEAYFVLIGHRTDFDRLRLGKLALWLTIQRLIQLGFRRYHLLWGMSSYKLQLGGRPHRLMEVAVFGDAWAAGLWRAERGAECIRNITQRVARIPFSVGRKLSAVLRPSTASSHSL
ncbi:MAG: GNAT family N-acetyltransferase [Nitrospira sp.]|nr:GNAT family N-acetyltransferase [Nitrospira sp.]MDH4302484.1 GNAT family N-acetyltransferase [Nitrospira sp.]MDH5192230.1 GNAT family N-acetyltransferase [Nitrospira sp.]